MTRIPVGQLRNGFTFSRMVAGLILTQPNFIYPLTSEFSNFPETQH